MVASLVVPVALRLLTAYLLHALLSSAGDRFHLVPVALTLAELVARPTRGDQPFRPRCRESPGRLRTPVHAGSLRFPLHSARETSRRSR